MTSSYREGEIALGPLVREHRWMLSRTLFVAGLVALPISALSYAALTPSGPIPIDVLTLLYYATFIGVPIATVAWMWMIAFRHRGDIVRVRERGFVHRWSGVETIVRY